jgi:hypothetical protein
MFFAAGGGGPFGHRLLSTGLARNPPKTQRLNTVVLDCLGWDTQGCAIRWQISHNYSSCANNGNSADSNPWDYFSAGANISSCVQRNTSANVHSRKESDKIMNCNIMADSATQIHNNVIANTHPHRYDDTCTHNATLANTCTKLFGGNDSRWWMRVSNFTP